MNTSDFSLFSKPNINRGVEYHSFVSEELEAEEDELRRNEEIKEMMQNAFDDLDEDCHSIHSSSYLASLSGCCNSKTSQSELSPWSNKQNFDEKQENVAYSHQQLQNGLNSRSHSENERDYFSKIQTLQTELDKIQKQFKEERSKWMEKFFHEEEEKKLAIRKQEEINELFYESQMMLLQRETELKNCEKKLKMSEEKKNEALEEVKLCKLTIKELEQRLASQEQKNFSHDEQVDSLMKKITLKDEQKFSDCQKEVQNLNEKLAQKEKKCFDLEQQLQELQQLHKSVVAEKCDTIAKLMHNLETCQSHCHKLMSTSNGKLNDIENPRKKSNVDTRQSLPVSVGGSTKLIEELCQTYAHIKEKNAENKFLQEQLKSCIKQIKLSKEAETKYVTDLATLKNKLTKFEERNHQLEEDNHRLKKAISAKQKESSVDHSDSENVEQYLQNENSQIAVLSKKLETSFEQCDTLKKMYLDVSTAKEKLLFQNQQLQADVDKLKAENANLNEIIKNQNTAHAPLCESLGQDSEYLTYCPQNDHNTDFENLQLNEVESLRNKLKVCEEKLKENALEHAKHLEVLRIGVQEYITNTENQHQKQITQLEEEYSKRIVECESKYHEQFCQFENEFKEQVMKVSTEEIKNLSNIFQRHFNDVSETVNRLQNDLEKKTKLVEMYSNQLNDANRQLQQREAELRDLKTKSDQSSKEWKEQLNSMNEKQEKLLLEIEKIYTKYKAARKAAVDLKQMLNTRSQLLLQHQQFYAQTLNEIQNYLNETLDCKSKNDRSITKFDITKEDLIVPDDEINAAIVAIKKQLESLKHR